jgi:hypothetical protein
MEKLLVKDQHILKIPSNIKGPEVSLILEVIGDKNSAEVYFKNDAFSKTNERLYNFEVAPKKDPEYIHTLEVRTQTTTTLNRILFERRGRPDFFHAGWNKTKDGYESVDMGGITENASGNCDSEFIRALRNIVDIPEMKSYLDPDITLTVLEWLTAPVLRIGVADDRIGSKWIDTNPVMKIGVQVGKAAANNFVYPTNR